MLLDIDERVTQPVNVGSGRNAIDAVDETCDGAAAGEIETGEKVRTVNGRLPDSLHVSVAMHMPQVRQVHGVLCDFLHVAGKPDGPDFQIAPVVFGRRRVRQVPLRRAARVAPPTKDEALNDPRIIDVQCQGSRRRRERRCDTVAGDIVREAVKGTDKTAIAHAAADGRAQCGTHVRTYRIGYADTSIVVAPRDDVPSKPLPFKQFFLGQGALTRDEVPPLGKREQGGRRVTHAALAVHVLTCSLLG